MKLSADQFEKMLLQLKSCGGERAAERRSGLRVGIRCHVHLLAVRNGRLGNPREVWTRDMSATGLGVISPTRMKPGEHFLLSLPRQKEVEQQRIVLYCTVASCRDLADGLFAIGLIFSALEHATLTQSFKASTPV